ncbi:DNA-directed RNA polymerase subunit beta [Paenibacillus sp. SC116]|uniref:DNA-directed RNA polymerase subunit beta n=1 Tax=Paenibacillus sp. SC116 TaxID=2968986 RepID=UPI00215A772F|nr:DNA-directed RNA polymerase subunit beta [Paenibacillus sp. SC116]MCR8844776.1 DNA-directed RNA polymerase subunit beta [Paenibacillus sp. SC116]
MENGKERIMANSQPLSRSNRYKEAGGLERSKSPSSANTEPDNKSGQHSNSNDVGKKSTALKWVFRLVVVPVLCLLMAYIGLAIGYVVIGNGELSEALSLKPLIHVYNLVFG